MNLIVVSLKGGMDKEKGPDAKEEKVKEPEKPADPTTDPVKINKKTLIDIKLDKKPAGVVLSGGYGSLTRVRNSNFNNINKTDFLKPLDRCIYILHSS